MVLALEFSSPQRSVAVVHRLPNAKWDARSEVIETGPGGTKSIAMIDAALRQASVEREQIDRIAVGLGPGSYNGIRLAIAMAQGWQLASAGQEIKLMGISSSDCIAAEAAKEGITGRAAVIINAQRGEFYVGEYELGPNQWRELEPLALARPEQVQEREAVGRHLIGPEVTRWFPGGRCVFPRAAMLGQLALGRSDFVSGQRLQPIYLRPIQFVKAPPPRIL